VTAHPQPPTPCPIGTPGIPWGEAERSSWRQRQTVKRAYADEVLARLSAALPPQAECLNYGELDYTALGLPRYPLHAVRSRDWQAGRPTVLVTGGVHGYETSGVQGALQWLAQDFARHCGRVNLLLLPCISPWGYETINRWNPLALDPNRQFRPDSPAVESALAMACVAAHAPAVDLHIDLHETTDTDASEFGPAKAARDGLPLEPETIPDGFYLVADSERPALEFQAALVDAVARVTHIAPPDAQGRLIGSPLLRHGVIAYPKRALGLCGGMTEARLVTTTEVYPDSPRATPAQCNEAQRVAVNAAIEFLLRG
jgi:hypothetical protein